jgi:glucose-1-phosphate adenylyltransferase
MSEPRIIAFVLAGGEGTRLRPLTDETPKPALACAHHCRVIDFALSNLHNSAIRSVFVLLQYKPRVLVEHIATHWNPQGAGEFVEPILPQANWRGTADAVRQNLDLLDGTRADLVAVFAADHIYRMDVRQMVSFHLHHDADATVAALSMPLHQASQFGVIRTGDDGRIIGFDEKPAHPLCCPDDPSFAYVSMGNYLFRPNVLRRALRDAARRGGHDFGRDVLPMLVEQANVRAYDFRRNAVPGLAPGEEAIYWRDVGTIEAYLDAQQDAQGLFPMLNLRNAAWPIRCTSATLPHGTRSQVPPHSADTQLHVAMASAACFAGRIAGALR